MASAFESSSEKSAERIRAVLGAVDSYDIKSSSGWQSLQSLAKNVQLDDREVDPAGIVLLGDRFKGAMNLYVLLQFGGAGKLETTESFLGQFEGHFREDGTAAIDDLRVNTSSFFA